MQQKYLPVLFLLVMAVVLALFANPRTAFAADLSAPTLVEKPLTNIVKLANGGGHTCVITTAGGVKCWGWNQYGQLGNSSNRNKGTPVDVELLRSGVSDLSAGFYFTCVLTTGGGVKCWGRNESGQLGNNSFADSSNPVDVIGLGGGVSAISAGSNHACALTTGGGVKCWGNNQYGQLGNNSTNNSPIPVDVVGLSSGARAVSVGSYHTCALATGGGVKCWGRNQYGQLGNGSTTDSLLPVDVVGLKSGVSAISAAVAHTCAVHSNGVQCWGANVYGQLGNNSTVDSHTPVDVSGLGSGIKALDAGGEYSCVVTDTNGVKCWGWNQYGQLGDNSTTDRLIPVEVSGLSGVTALSVSYHTCVVVTTGVVTTGGGVKCWGWNGSGQLGNDTPGDSRKPVAVSGLTGASMISAGTGHSCALTTVGGVKCWGWNVFGQLGDTSLRDRSTPVDVFGVTSGVSAVSAGGGHTCVRMTTGGAKCWGDNRFGQLGNGSSAQQSAIVVDVFGVTSDVSNVSAGGAHTCAVVNGGARCWGANNLGQLGNGSLTDSNVPVDVIGLSSGVSAINAGEHHTCAITANGSLKCWGANQSGQLGNGTFLSSTIPVDVSGLSSGVITVGVGSDHTCALLTNGGAKCWGANNFGQLGDTSTISKNTPVDVMGVGGTISAIQMGRTFTCALLQTGRVQCWGDNRTGQLGDNSTDDRLLPTDVSGLSGANALSVNGYHACALTNGSVKCWGANVYGALGNGTAWFTTPVDVGEINYFRVQDEQGAAVANAEVWVESANQNASRAAQSKVILQTDQDGYFLLPTIQPGDQLIALQLMREERAAGVAHQGWKYRIYRTSMDIGPNGELQPYRFDNASGRTLTVKKRNPLVLFNLVVALEWQSYLDNTTNVSALEVIENAVRNASDLLYDATDGQFAFGQVSIYDGGRYWQEADWQLLASNYVRPFAIPGGVTESGPYTYTGANGVPSTFYPGYIRSGRAWNRYGDPTSKLDDPDGYHMLVHEFAHWAFGLLDEYFYVEGGVLHPATCAPPSAATSPLDYSLMDRSYAATEFEMQGSQAFTDACRATEQFRTYGESAWETIQRAYGDRETVARWEFTTPAPNGSPKAGPTNLHLQLGLPVIASQGTDPANLANRTGEVKLKLTNGLAQESQSGGDQPTTTYTGHVQVFLLKQPNGDTQILEQGTTDQSGYIRLVGVEVGDRILAVSWDGTLAAETTYQQGATLSLVLTAAPWSPIITARPVLNPLGQPTALAVTVAQAGVLAGELNAVHIPAGATALSPVPLTKTGALYTGQVPLSTTLVITAVTEGKLWLFEKAADQAQSRALPQRQIVTTYASGGSPDSHVRSNPPKDPSTSDGYCAFHVSEETAQSRIPAIVLPTRNTPPLPVGATRLQIVSAPCYIGLPTGHETFSQPTPLLMYYNQRVVDELDPTTPLRIYYWNESTQQWVVKPSQDDPRNYFLSTTITQTGLYVAAAELPARVQVVRANRAGEVQLNVVNNPLLEALAISRLTTTCPAEKIFATQGGSFERWYSNAPAYVTNLTAVQPGQSAQLVPAQDCVIDLGQGVLQAAASTVVTGATAITLPLTTIPATFYGSITVNSGSLPPGLTVVAKINDDTYGRGVTMRANNATVFVVDVPADDPETALIEGGQPGQTVIFQVGEEVVGQTGVWQAAQASAVNLVVTEVPLTTLYLPVIHR